MAVAMTTLSRVSYTTSPVLQPSTFCFFSSHTSPSFSFKLLPMSSANASPVSYSMSYTASSLRSGTSLWGSKLTIPAASVSDASMFSGSSFGSDYRLSLGEKFGLSSRNVACTAQTDWASMSEAEKDGWEKRKSEAAEAQNAGPFTWQWTLNWDAITPNILVGSCPRSPGDIDRLVEEAGIDAILNLQCDLCFDALKIPFDAIRNRAVEREILLERVAVRDFDHGDQTLMLPVAVRMLNMLLARGLKVYVHCTAGINRATLTVVGYLTFVKGREVDHAVGHVKSARKVAHPYMECWSEVRRRLLDGRQEEITGTSVQIYESRCERGVHGNSESDWAQAERRVISGTFQRWLETDLGAIEMETALLRRKHERELQKLSVRDGNRSSRWDNAGDQDSAAASPAPKRTDRVA